MSKPSTLAAWLALLERRHPLTIDLGLERVRAVWELMGGPMPASRLVTVAGTNGKGSTTAYISAMLTALGYRCGSYTSPHLLRYNERVQIQGAEATDQDLIGAFERVEAARGEISLSYFEFGTLAAFDLLSRAALDFAVLEVGLGGRLDAVNILHTDCAVITAIGLDHQEYLGHDIDSVGREKAGIIRAGKPLICGEANPPHSVLEAAARCGALLQRPGREFSVAAQVSAEPQAARRRCLGQRDTIYVWRQGSNTIQLPQPAMPGLHQVENMATAVAAVCALVPGAPEQADALAQGLKSVSLAGRLQPSADCPRVWLDVGHNPHAAQAVAAALQNLRWRPAICVLGMLRDKDAPAVAAILDELVQYWYCAGIGGERGRSGAELAQEVARVSGSGRVRDFPDVASALAEALEATAGDGQRVLVFGSFATVAKATAFLEAGSQL